MADNKNKIQAGEFEADVITLTLDDDTELDCAVLCIFDDVEGYDYTYAAMIPVDKIDDEDGEIFLYRFEEISEEDVNIENIESDEEFEAVSARFDAMLDEAEFNNIEE